MRKKFHYSRRSFIQASLVTGLGLSLNLYGCTKSVAEPTKEPTTPDSGGGDDGKFSITGVLIAAYIDATKGSEYSISGKGFAVGDQLYFESRANMTATGKHTITSKTVTADQISFVFPMDIPSDSYRISVKRGSQSLLLGTTILNLYFNANIPDRAGMTIKGVVYAAGAGLANVVVSDGFEVTTTDENGVYYLPSTKKGRYVFVSIPGNYEVVTTMNAPQFFQRLNQPIDVVETKDFELKAVNNEKHTVMILGDMHLARRTDDLNQFQKGFLPDVNKSIQAYKNAGNKVYALTLGDMTWESYWYSNNYALPQYLTEMNKIEAMVFNTMGNHDNDPKAVGDWESENTYRSIIGPTYYSFNLGKIHYIVLDNIEYLNVNDARNYNTKIVENQIEWLKKDLATLTDKSTPVVVAMHAHLHSNPSLNSSGSETSGYRIINADDFVNALKAFTTVHVITGHTHINYNVETAAAPNIMEHNTGAVCATWWWTGNVGYAGNHICKDGAPGGYAIWEMQGRDLKWKYKAIGENEDYQFRAYDLNKVHLTREKYAPAYNGAEWNNYAAEYANASTANEVLINVWNYDKNWKVEVIENGQPLKVTRVRMRDPLHIISYSAQRLNRNAVPTEDFVTSLTAHMFKVKASSPTSTLQIRVTDRFGKVYQESMVRPKALGYLMK
ncbi:MULTISPECIES: calcineurin-like phosphoesterase C-terminal domain-containing protein [Sphingobacterium]|uniref:calcineurin-like phosphoesterase C-terminal domain-containing protein n=1 Tax=Sphingobacterium TaxID=28453 RepID=UPI0013D8F200|nr:MULTISPECIES: calcineurin-like phosphoesterase family protein [unclassified Sphingobacterium]